MMRDPDAPLEFTHWIVFNIPPSIHFLPEGASGKAGMPQGSVEGTNDFGHRGYGGPCPPGGRPHHYVFQIFALDIRLGLQPGASRKQFEAAFSGHILAEGELTGLYRGSSR